MKVIKQIEDKLEFPDAMGFKFIENEIFYLFDDIERTDCIEQTDSTFKILEQIQFALAKAVFKNGVIVTSFLRKFIYDFDRIDDEDVRVNLYNKIRSKEYI